jgi:predicted secreted protein
MAALGAASAYQANGSATQATLVAKDIVAASGLATDAATLTVTLPYTSGTTAAVKVQITTAVPIRLATMVAGGRASYNVTASGVASLPMNSTPACITALSSSVTYGVSITGGTSLTASGCAVAANSGVSSTAGTYISAKQVVAGKTVYDQPLSWGGAPGITTTPTANNIQQNKANAAIDPVGSDSRVIAGFARLGTHTTPATTAANPADWNFDYNHSGPVAGYWNSSTGSYVLPPGTYDKIANMTIVGGMTVTFLGASTVTMSGSLSVGGGGKLYMGTTKLDVGGAISLGGGAVMTIASGDTTIGTNGTNAVYVDGGSTLTFGNGTFSANGNVVTSGGSNINFGTTGSHYINGALNLSGSSTFGAGAYYINGNFSNNTGGSMTGSEVTFFLGGALTLSGGTSMNLAAPTSDNGGGVTDLLFATKSTVQTRLGGGSQNVYAGMVYAPNSDMVMDGGAGATGNGRCFSLVVNTFTMNGGTAAGTACTSFAASSGLGGAVALIQ